MPGNLSPRTDGTISPCRVLTLPAARQARRSKPPSSETTKRIKKIKNKILATPAEAAASPPKPNAAATSATTRKISVQRNMGDLRFSEPEFDDSECIHGDA